MTRSNGPYFVTQLAEHCDRHTADPKVVFVPSRQIGHNVGNALATMGCSWVNLHLSTPEDWAERLAGPHLRARGWRPLVQDADRFFVEALVRETRWPEGHPLAAGFASAGVARTLLRTLRALRAAGVDSKHVASATLRNGSLLAEMYETYSAWMQEHRLYDRAMLFAEATTHVGAGSDSFFAIFDETPLQRTSFDFVTALSDGRIERIGRRSYDAPLPQFSAGVRFPRAPMVGGGLGLIHPAGQFNGRGLLPEHASVVHLREAVGTENEIRGVLRELLAEETPLDTVELAYTQEEIYLPLLVSVADRFGIAMTSAAGVPVTGTAAGQSLLSFFRWMSSGFDTEILIRMCRSRLIETRTISPGEIARVLDEVRIGSGFGAHRAALKRFAEQLDSDRERTANESSRRRIDGKRATLERVHKILDKLFAICPSVEAAPLREVCLAGVQFLDDFVPSTRSSRDSRAAESLRDRLIDLANSVEVTATVEEHAALVAELISTHKIEASIARPGHLYVVPLTRAGYAGRKRTVVVGLAESSFPGAVTEDPMLLDDERRLLSRDLVIERSRSGEATWHLGRALGLSGGRVTLTANRRSVSEGRETYPSAVFHQFVEQLGGRDVIEFYHPVPDPKQGLDEAEIALAVRRTPGVLEILEQERPWLACGHQAERERRYPSLGRFNGWLGRATPELRPDAGTPISVSRLEDLAACPYRYFLKYVLNIRPPREKDVRPGHWLSPLEFGSLLHDILRSFMEDVMKEGGPVNISEHASEMEDILDQKVSEMRERVPVGQETGYRVDVSRLRRAARIFLNEEAQRDAVPIGCEVSFGLGKSGGLNRPDPIHLEISETLRLLLKGSIDRVDRGSDGYEVWDYKTSSTFDFDEQDLFMRGRKLQWALYAYALSSILGDENGGVSKSGYFFTSDREHGLRLSDVPPPSEELARRIEPLFDLVGEGGFLHVQKSDACTFCDYRVVCASEKCSEDQLGTILDEMTDEPPFLNALKRWMEV